MAKKDEDLIIVKQEPRLLNDEENDFDGGGDGFCSELLKPMEGLRKVALPPFLKKTFEKVDNPNTDSVIFWSSTRNSFIVWDPHKISMDLLPKHFKHNISQERKHMPYLSSTIIFHRHLLQLCADYQRVN
ncbi:heat stress transcription factor A-7a-like [Abeliophyllum distichum]|uniref:Heat stress transcription factor A-7a-like n=1 Tax=Abeliophyllum distichum TaxID=126358 RepID=A0ABD1VYX0_9LAMI